jgi:uncharacterized protein YpiB (UPF0302 family)
MKVKYLQCKCIVKTREYCWVINGLMASDAKFKNFAAKKQR